MRGKFEVRFLARDVYTSSHMSNRKVRMRFRLRDTLFGAHYRQFLPVNYYVEKSNLILRWADARGKVQP